MKQAAINCRFQNRNRRWSSSRLTKKAMFAPWASKAMNRDGCGGGHRSPDSRWRFPGVVADQLAGMGAWNWYDVNHARLAV